MIYWRRKFFEWAITFLDPVKPLNQEQYDGLLSQMWQNPSFRFYVAERDKKIVFQLAGGEGMKPDPREDYTMLIGQRTELLLLASGAKLAYDRTVARSKEAKEVSERAQH